MLMKKVLRVWKNEGIEMVLYKIKLKLDLRNIFLKYIVYKKWIDENETDVRFTEKLSYNPLISVVIPVYNVDAHILRDCIESVLDQTYKNFEIVLVDDASTQPSVYKVLHRYERRPKVTVIYRKDNGHISQASNDGIKASKGEFVAFCDCDDLYAPNALYEVAKKLNEDRTLDHIYSDEDKINEKGNVRRDPFFKPDWSPQTFMSYMYPCHLSVYRKAVLEEVSGFRVGFEGSQDYDLLLRVMERTDRIGHIPKILYHWRMRKGSTADKLAAKPYIFEAARKAKEEALLRRGEKGELTLLPDIGQYRVTYLPRETPLVSIIIPSKDNPEMLAACLTSISAHTDYSNYEIIVVDNGSNEKNQKRIETMIVNLKKKMASKDSFRDILYLYQPIEFNFSRMCNLGASKAKGDFLLFLNDDIEISESVKQNDRLTSPIDQWLTILTGQAQVSYTGAVGCKLYYPNSIQLQHSGILNLPIGPGHCLYGSSDDLNYYYGRNLLDYNFCAVTGACLMIERKKFDEAGGFDEELPVAYNDVELCFRLVELGYYNVLRNDVALVHHESVSRGLDEASKRKEKRRIQEMKKLYEKHPGFSGGYDPCYNPNLAPDKGDFSLNVNALLSMQKVVKLRAKSRTEYKRLKPNRKILVYQLNQIVERENVVQISGWIYNRRKKNNAKNKVKLFLKNEANEMFVVNTTKKERTDLQVKNYQPRGMMLTGFETEFSIRDLLDGRYKIGIGMDRMYVMSEKQLNIDKSGSHSKYSQSRL